jgi:hypothetical protein
MRTYKYLLCATSLCLPLQILASQTPNLGYQSAEHIFMGDQVVLHGLPQPAPKQLIQLTLANGIKLTYGDLVAMPDYYGDPNHQISSESTFEGRKQQFTKLFDSFTNYDVSYFNAFWPVVLKEQQEVAAALKAHKSVSDVYKKINTEEMIALEKATKGKYLELAARCFDHFNSDAWLAYQAGHSVAIDTAIAAHNIADGSDTGANATCAKSTDKKQCLENLATDKLKIAYEQNGYANHFLTDHMAAGHTRTPFRALITTRPIPDMGGISGGYMHNEDNRYGIVVTNSSGKYWMAYGDNYYFSKGNTYHRGVIKQVIQLSADEVYDAYIFGYNSDPMSSRLDAILPEPIEPGRTVNAENIGKVTEASPLYKVVSGVVWERKDINNRNDDEWTPNWTTIELLRDYKLNK